MQPEEVPAALAYRKRLVIRIGVYGVLVVLLAAIGGAPVWAIGVVAVLALVLLTVAVRRYQTIVAAVRDAGL